MSQDLLKIRNVAIISSAVLIVAEILCFIFFARTDFYGILLSGMLTFVFFMATLIFYMLAARSQVQSKLKYLLIILIIKLVVSAAVFYLVYRSEYIGMLAFAFSFLIFFTVFFNLEIFMIYRKILFYRN